MSRNDRVLLVPHSAADWLFLRFRKVWPFQNLVASHPVPWCCVLPTQVAGRGPRVWCALLPRACWNEPSLSLSCPASPRPLVLRREMLPSHTLLPFPLYSWPSLCLFPRFPMPPWALQYWMALLDSSILLYVPHPPCTWCMLSSWRGSWGDGFPAHRRSGVQCEPPSRPLTQLPIHAWCLLTWFLISTL